MIRVWTRALDAAIIVGFATLGVGYFHRQRPAQSTTMADFGVQVGSKFAFAATWPNASRHLVIAVHTSCHVCNDSLPYYRRLADACSQASDCKLIVISLERAGEVSSWLAAAAVRGPHVQAVTLEEARGIYATPTLALVKNGVITDLAVGRLADEQEKLLLDRVRGLPGVAPLVTERLPDIVSTPGDLSALRNRDDLAFVDVRDQNACLAERDPRRLCMPLGELVKNAPNRFSRALPIAVDCSALATSQCHHVAGLLYRMGFLEVKAIVAESKATPIGRWMARWFVAPAGPTTK